MADPGSGAHAPETGRISLALVHYPCVDRNQEIYSTSVTNLDVHDIARSCRTYGLARYYLVHPVWAQREMAKTIANFWQVGKGKERNPDRMMALELVEVAESIQAVLQREEEWGRHRPLQIATSAKPQEKTWSFAQVREAVEKKRNVILWLGTGHGLAPEILEQSDGVLEPIFGPTDYNHLSVRSAAAIMLDRLCGEGQASA